MNYFVLVISRIAANAVDASIIYYLFSFNSCRLCMYFCSIFNRFLEREKKNAKIEPFYRGYLCANFISKHYLAVAERERGIERDQANIFHIQIEYLWF